MTDEARDSSAVAGRDATLTTTAKGGQELPQATVVTGDDRRHFPNDFDKNAGVRHGVQVGVVIPADHAPALEEWVDDRGGEVLR